MDSQSSRCPSVRTERRPAPTKRTVALFLEISLPGSSTAALRAVPVSIRTCRAFPAMLGPRLTSISPSQCPGGHRRRKASPSRRRAGPRWGRAPVSDLRDRPCAISRLAALATGSCCAARSRDGSCGGPRAPSARPLRPSPRPCACISATSLRSFSISCFELHHPFHALEVEPCFGRAPGWNSRRSRSAPGIAAGTPRGAVRLDQPTTLVDPQSLGVDPGETRRPPR